MMSPKDTLPPSDHAAIFGAQALFTLLKVGRLF